MRLRAAILALLLLTPLAATAADVPGMALYNQANDTYRAGDMAKTIAICDQALLEPNVPGLLRSGILHVRAAAQSQLSQFDGAIADYDRALAAMEPELSAAPQFKESHTDLLWERGVAEFYDGRYAAAVADFTAVLVERPGDVRTLAERGRAYGKLGKRAEAIADLDAALKRDPKDQDAAKWRAELQ